MTEAKVGIVVTKEIVTGVNEIVLELVKQFKDGVQVSDIPALISAVLASDAIKALFADLFTKMAEFKAETGDLDSQEIAELIVMEALFVPQLLAALKK
jgi:hypothetical protein